LNKENNYEFENEQNTIKENEYKNNRNCYYKKFEPHFINYNDFMIEKEKEYRLQLNVIEAEKIKNRKKLDELKMEKNMLEQKYVNKIQPHTFLKDCPTIDLDENLELANLNKSKNRTSSKSPLFAIDNYKRSYSS
jgi:hypothetical protein